MQNRQNNIITEWEKHIIPLSSTLCLSCVCYLCISRVILKGKIDAILCLISGLEWHTKNGIHAVLQSCLWATKLKCRNKMYERLNYTPMMESNASLLWMTCGMPVLTAGSVSGLRHSAVCNGFFYIHAHNSKKHESKDYILGQFHKLHTTHLMNVP